jgi:flagellin
VADGVDSLRRSWLANAEQLIDTYYGLQGDGASIKIVFDESGSHPAFVWGQDDGTGKLTNLELHINLAMMQNLTLPNGGSAPQYADRIIAHEMVHAIMGRTMDFTALPNWFVEGAAEFIQGADERLRSDLIAAGGVANLVNEIDSWEGDSADYSAGYAAVKYLHNQILAAGGAGIRDLFDRLEAGDTLSAAIAATAESAVTGVNFTGLAQFETEFKSAAGGQAFISGLTLSDADPGAIVPGMTAETVVPDSDTNTWDPLQHFAEVWPEKGTVEDVEPIRLQIGPNVGDTIDVPELMAGTYELNLIGVDLVGDADGALRQIDGAIKGVVGLRSELGAIQNRLEHTYNAQAIQAENLTAAESRIRDLDMAAEMTNLVKQQVLLQSSTAMLAQANVMHRDAMRVLLGA